MAETKQYISQVQIGNDVYYVKDAELRDALRGLTGAMRWLGITTTEIDETDHSAPDSIVIGTSTITKANLVAGDVVGYLDSEFIWNGTSWQEFGSTGSLQALAFKSEATGTYTPQGTNSTSNVTLNGGGSGKLVTTSITGVSGNTTASSVTSTNKKLVTTSITGTNGTETVSKVTKTSSKLVTTSITPVNGTESVSKVTKTASKLVTTSIPNVTGNADVTIPNVTENKNVDIPNVTSVGTASDWSFTVNNETLTIGGGNGTAPTLGTALSASKVTLGTALSASKVTLGTVITAATGAVASDGAGSDIITAVNISDKDVAKAGTSITVATGAVDTEGTGSDIVTAVTISDKTVAKVASNATTVATGALDANGGGATIIDSVTVSDVTVPVAASATTVATGTVSDSGTGSTVVTALHTGGTAAAQTFTGTQATITVS